MQSMAHLFAKAFQLVAESNYGDKVSLVLSKLVRDLCIGEITQDRSLFQVPTLTEYYYKIRMKTAVFLASCCRLGGIVAEIDKDEVEALTDYGINLGLAFQITDDLLDFFGDTKVTGKALGGDLKSGVITLPVIRAFEVSHQSKRLCELVTNQNITESDITEAINVIKKSDALEYCNTRAFTHIEAARISLSNLIDSSVTRILEKIAIFVVDRTW